VALVGVVGGVLALAERGADTSAAGRAASLADALPDEDPLRPPPRLGLAVATPRLLAPRTDEVVLWAPVLRPAAVRAAPSAAARIVGRVTPSTPERTENIVLVTGATRVSGRLWVPIEAAGTSGWAPRDALGGYESVDTRLLVDTEELTATLLRGGNVVFSAPIGVGTSAAPTPTGSFYVRNRLTRYRSTFYGPVAFGTSARSTLTDWPAGGFVGIHGTSRPDLLPGRVSHGCIRMRNADILELARLMPVGTPLEIT
jgi:lipoprotein-anchoring transpeptidase ErfK/SrfK